MFEGSYAIYYEGVSRSNQWSINALKWLCLKNKVLTKQSFLQLTLRCIYHFSTCLSSDYASFRQLFNYATTVLREKVAYVAKTETTLSHP